MPDIEIDEDETPAHVTVVYDPQNGRVVALHEFYGGTFNADECAQAALKTAASVGLATEGMAVLHPSGFRMRHDTVLKVDLKSRQLVATSAPRLDARVLKRLPRAKPR
jgi:hypothetical protein